MNTNASVCLLLSLLASQATPAAPPARYECTLEKALGGSRDLVLLLATADGEIRQRGVKIPDLPATPCRIREDLLKLDGNRLSGRVRIQVGPLIERLDLDVALDKEGTYTIAYGNPDTPRRVDGTVTVEAPTGADRKRWVLFLQDALRPETRLGLVLKVDREARTVEFVHGWDSEYSRAPHPLAPGLVTFDGAVVEGQVGITLLSGGNYPDSRPPVEGTIRLSASLDRKDKAGVYSAVFGVDRDRRGRVAVKPVTEAQMREVLAPVLPPRQAPWRVWLAAGPQVSNPPPAGWAGRDFDDSLWGRHGDDLYEFMGGYGCPVNSGPDLTKHPALLCLRTRFGVSDPAAVTDLAVTVEYLGGVVVRVNGEEVGRGHMPAGAIEPHTPALDYPIEAYTADDGTTPLPGVSIGAKPDAKWLPRYQARVRRTTFAVPAKVLVKGANVLALELHRAALAGPVATGLNGWSHVAIRDVRVDSATGAGVIPYPDASKGPRVWSAQPTDQVTETATTRCMIGYGWGSLETRGMPLKGITAGNPFDPVVPIRILVPRNGVGNGQVVVSDPEGLKAVRASVSDFKGPGGAVLQAASARIRFAAQTPDLHYCDSLLDAPPDGARNVPVWLEVRAAATQAPGWYVSDLSVEANGKSFKVPAQVFVSGFTAPDTKDFRSVIVAMHSPEAVAKVYKVSPWSDDHFRLMGKSLEMAGQLGGDIMFVPVILGTHMGYESGLIRWVKSEQGLSPDFSLFEKYLDLYVKHCGPPKAVVLYVWSPESAKEVSDVYENRQIPMREAKPSRPLQVTQWDPQTGAATNVVAPSFLDEGAGKFWQPMLDGVRDIVVRKRGWPERLILLGSGSDIRPSQKAGAAVRQWAPYARWNIYSHFSGDPGAFYKGPQLPGSAPGKFIALGGLEVGLKELPNGGIYSAAQLEKLWQAKNEYIEGSVHRGACNDGSGPMVFRTVPMHNGSWARVGIDFWPGVSRYYAPVWGTFPARVAARGPDGPVPTVRLQMMREALQDFEARMTILDALPRLPADRQNALRALLDDLLRRATVGERYLSQTEVGLDWYAYAARLHQAAAELSGAKTEATWDQPPK